MGINKILVSGSEGYIGTVLVPLLISHGYTVVGLDTCFYGRSSNTGYHLIQKDIRHISKEDLAGCDAVIHLAALSNDPMGALDEALTHDINFMGSVLLAKTAKKVGVKRFLFSSSCSIYGKAENGTVNESSTVTPLTAYARSKIDTEHELKQLADSDFTIGLLRNSTVYGYSPMFRDDLVVNNFVTTALATGEIRVKSDGSPWRPLIDVRDLAKIFIEFLTVEPGLVNGDVINVGFDENNVQVKDVLSTVSRCIPSCTVMYTGEHGVDTRSYRVDFAKFHRIFPHVIQQWTIEKSVMDMIEALKKVPLTDKTKMDSIYTRITVLLSLKQRGIVDDKLYMTKSGKSAR